MKLGNLACGAVRPQAPEWWNVDSLRATLLPETPERVQLDSEPRYIDQDLEKDGLPFDDNSFDGLLCSHFLEHVDCQQAAKIMRDCHRVLKPGGVLLVSVPDASYFRKVHHEDTAENAERLFGEPIFAGDGETTFFGYGLWNKWHKAILSEDTLWAYFRRAGFKSDRIYRPLHPEAGKAHANGVDPFNEMLALLNRLAFSLVMCGVKE